MQRAVSASYRLRDFDFDERHAQVITRETQTVRLDFDATASPGAESVEDYNFRGSETLS